MALLHWQFPKQAYCYGKMYCYSLCHYKFAQNNVKSQTITQAPGVELSYWYTFINCHYYALKYVNLVSQSNVLTEILYFTL